MFFETPSNGDSFRIRLFARSLLVLTGAAHHEWHGGIPRRREDEVFGVTVPRTIPRLALILRHISQASSPTKARGPDTRLLRSPAPSA